jgi:hypothetical protein
MLDLPGGIQEDTNMLASDRRTQIQMLLGVTLPFYTCKNGCGQTFQTPPFLLYNSDKC